MTPTFWLNNLMPFLLKSKHLISEKLTPVFILTEIKRRRRREEIASEQKSTTINKYSINRKSCQNAALQQNKQR